MNDTLLLVSIGAAVGFLLGVRSQTKHIRKLTSSLHEANDLIEKQNKTIAEHQSDPADYWKKDLEPGKEQS